MKALLMFLGSVTCLFGAGNPLSEYQFRMTQAIITPKTFKEGIERLPARKVTAEEILGSKENVRLVEGAAKILVERVSVPPKVKNLHWENGRIVAEELDVIIWNRLSTLRTEKGPQPVSDEMAVRIKRLLTQSYIYRDDGIRIGSGYLPRYRFTISADGRSVEVLLIQSSCIIAVFQNGKQVGGRHHSLEIEKLVDELDKVFGEEGAG